MKITKSLVKSVVELINQHVIIDIYRETGKCMLVSKEDPKDYNLIEGTVMHDFDHSYVGTVKIEWRN